MQIFPLFCIYISFEKKKEKFFIFQMLHFFTFYQLKLFKYSPGLLDNGCRFLEGDGLWHEQHPTDLHEVPVALPGLSSDSRQGRLRVVSE